MSMEAITVSFAVVVEKDGTIHSLDSGLVIFFSISRVIFCEGIVVNGVQTFMYEYYQLLPVLETKFLRTTRLRGC